MQVGRKTPALVFLRHNGGVKQHFLVLALFGLSLIEQDEHLANKKNTGSETCRDHNAAYGIRLMRVETEVRQKDIYYLDYTAKRHDDKTCADKDPRDIHLCEFRELDGHYGRKDLQGAVYKPNNVERHFLVILFSARHPTL